MPEVGWVVEAVGYHGSDEGCCACAGHNVRAGQGVAVLSAMKMETSVAAPCDGLVQHVAVEKGDVIDAGMMHSLASTSGAMHPWQALSADILSESGIDVHAHLWVTTSFCCMVINLYHVQRSPTLQANPAAPLEYFKSQIFWACSLHCLVWNSFGIDLYFF